MAHENLPGPFSAGGTVDHEQMNAILGVLAAAPHFASGTYAGDGNARIVNVGFRARLVVVQGGAGAWSSSTIRFAVMAHDRAIVWRADQAIDNWTSLAVRPDAVGFQVTASVNVTGNSYRYVAIGID